MPVLYRTHRPSKWSEVIGQDHIVDALKESISSKHISHAYLFSGGRGTGKTTVARIMANELKTADEDITRDLISIVHCFAAKIYSLRRKRRKIVEAIQSDV